MGLIRDRQGNYKLTGRTTEHDVLAATEGILRGYDAASATKMGGARHQTVKWHLLLFTIFQYFVFRSEIADLDRDSTDDKRPNITCHAPGKASHPGRSGRQDEGEPVLLFSD